MGWVAVPIIFLICFTLYGIEGYVICLYIYISRKKKNFHGSQYTNPYSRIGEELEDPFGIEKNDIKMDAIISDCKEEVMVLFDSWKRNGEEYRV